MPYHPERRTNTLTQIMLKDSVKYLRNTELGDIARSYPVGKCIARKLACTTITNIMATIRSNSILESRTFDLIAVIRKLIDHQEYFELYSCHLAEVNID